jgi:glucose-6-phosphate 1-dehydrogenase
MATTEVRVSPEDVRQAASQVHERIPEPSVAVIFGASGDLTKRKLLPALFHLEQAGLLPEQFRIVGVARRNLANSFAEDMREGIVEFGGVDKSDGKLDEFVKKIAYHAMDFDNEQGYASLRELLSQFDRDYGTRGNRLFYLATAPDYFADIVHRLGSHGMAKPEVGTVRVIIEKPFGHDLESAKELNDDVNTVFGENQIFRIDHYLGKETVQNVLVFRFANGIFEPIWNRNFVDHVQITAAENIGIEGRGPFYEKAGAPARRHAEPHHGAALVRHHGAARQFRRRGCPPGKNQALDFHQAAHIFDCVRGQYGAGIIDNQMVKGYREEDRVDPQSQTETYAAVRLEIDNWRWAGVPFYMRAGKRLAKRVTEITIQFKQPPMLLFGTHMHGPCTDIQPNMITMAHPAGRRHLPPLRRQSPGSADGRLSRCDGLQLRACLRILFSQRLRAAAARCHARRCHTFRAPRRRRDHLGSLHASARRLGEEVPANLPQLRGRNLGAGVRR